VPSNTETSPGTEAGAAEAAVELVATGRVRRHEFVYANDDRFAPTALVPAPPPRPVKPPAPLGELATASAEEVASLVTEALGGAPDTRNHNRWGIRGLLAHLERYPGQTWQQRWESAGLNEPGTTVTMQARMVSPTLRRRLNAAAGHAFAVRLVQPSLRAFRSYLFSCYPRWFRTVARDPLLEDFCSRVEALPVSRERHHDALFDVCCALTVFGIELADLTPEALLHYATECRKYGLTRGTRPGEGSFAATQAWPVLYDMGQFPASAPRTLRVAVTKGQRSISELVDRHRLRNTDVRDLLVDYITRRATELDYAATEHLARYLTLTFWKQIETINPSQDDLRLDENTIAAWKQWLRTLPNGQPRLNVDGPMVAIRSLYLDLHTWAAAEPERWARWVAPSPIRDTDLRKFPVRRRRLQERMAHRTRERQPLLPILSNHVNDRWTTLRTLLDAARAVELGERFTVDGTTYQRTASDRDRQGWTNPEHAPVRVLNRDTGDLIRLSHAEDQAFWQWAIVETLRLAGLRVEELTELTHLSVRNYQRPNGEVVALLVITPSKSDRERVIPMSAELFHVIAQVIRRHIRDHGTVPVALRYDTHERTWCPPLPYLFQNLRNSCRRAMSMVTIGNYIRKAVEAVACTLPEFAGITFSPHDFRRLFATELVNNGLPIHIGAALLGHLNAETTRGYVAVFDENVISHYQQFLDRRRAQRPDDEYRAPTTKEWQDFQEHFDKRRVELGSCGRPYGTPCVHEHACIRCPMLSINPKMLPRLDELEQDLLARRHRAVEENWRGEIEGIDLTLTFLRSKRTRTQRNARLSIPTQVDLGMPTHGPTHRQRNS
jgi:site-specific recombinase XerD